MRGIGVSSLKRSPIFPDIPTIAEAGVPGYETNAWGGIVVPVGTSRAIVKKLNAEINQALQSPTLKERYAAIEAEPVGGTARSVRRLRQKRDGEMGGRGQEIRRETRLNVMAATSNTYDLIVRNATSSTARARRAFRARSACAATDRRIGTLDQAQRRHRNRRLRPDRGARFHRRAHARRPHAVLRSGHDAQSESGRDDCGRRQLRHQSRALARASGWAITPPLDLLDGSGDWFNFPTFRAYREELAAKPAAINATCLVGHTTFRVAAMDRLDRAATRRGDRAHARDGA